MPEALATLVRLAGAEVDARRLELAALRQRAHDLDERRRRLDLEMDRERCAAAENPVLHSYAAWAAAASERQRALQQDIAVCRNDLATAQAAVVAAWRRKRSLELALEARARRAAADAARAEQAILDELALGRFRRRGG